MDLDDWIAANKPYCWKEATRHEQYLVLEDFGFGMMAVFKNGKLSEIGKGFIQLDDLIILGYSYGMDKPTIFKKV